MTTRIADAKRPGDSIGTALPVVRREISRLPAGTGLVSEVYLGRQPIYDALREIQAYELLYRGAARDTTAVISDGDRASAEVMLKAFLEIGLQTVSPSRPVFINFSEPLLGVDPLIPPDRCVIEVLESVSVTTSTVACLEKLKSQGYRLALDDFVYAESADPFLRLATFVKLDVRAMSPEEFRRQLDLVRAYDVRIIAEKVESQEDLDRCRGWGCDLFQGYYLRRPETLSGKRAPSNRLSLLALLSECVNSASTVNAIASVIQRDAVLTYNLLKLANSAMYQRTYELHSTVQAITMLGLDFVFRWVTLLVLAGNQNCPSGYLDYALQRARTCELIASFVGCQRSEAYFVGLLSALDSMFDMPMASIIEPLPLGAEIKAALLAREGKLGVVLEAVTAYESGQIDTVLRTGINVPVLQKAFWEAVEYANTMLATLGSVTPQP
ncbi:MAG TPA: HDOD domain-containing protein [Bryobacteraceae bacterium]|nr:HDOD domain-containing protein [Bryobacteraceae bacterium]